MNTKIVLVAISYLLGSIGGLYLNRNIILFSYLFLLLYLVLSKKIILKFIIILAFILACYTTNSKLEFVNSIYSNKELTIYGTIIDKEKVQGKIKYSAQITKCSNNHKYEDYKMFFYSNIKLDVGEFFFAEGSFSNSDKFHNYKGFSYKNLLLSKGFIGTFNILKVDGVKCEKNFELVLFHSIKKYICNVLDESLPQSNAELCKSLILGNKSGLDDDIIESFSNSSISHTLAISGMHVMYISSIIMLCTCILKKSISYIINIVVIIFFCRLVGSGESVYRATIMISLFLISKILHRNSDSITNLSVALIAVLIRNPFCVYNVGFQLSFIGTLGIIVLYKKINIKSCIDNIILYYKKALNSYKIKHNILHKFSRESLMHEQMHEFNEIPINKKMHEFKENSMHKQIHEFKENKKCKNAIVKPLLLYIKSQIALSISANIFLLPIIAVNYNKVSINFFISSAIASILLTIIMPLICICLIFNNRINFISIFFSKLLYIVSSGLIKFSQIIADVEWMTYLVVTPSTIEIIFYFFIVLIFCGIMYGAQKDKKILQKLCVKLIAIWIICCLIINCCNHFRPGIEIFFIDVGQGDATLVITEKNKKILIDGGGDDNGKDYIGKNVLLPYLLDRRVKSLDYIVISHFDTDHIRWNSICNG